MSRPRALFFGTPEIAVPALEATHAVCDVVLVITQPDRPAGRGLELAEPAVKKRARELGIAVAQPTKVKTPEFAESLRALGADVAVVMAYGRILPRPVLDAPRLGCVNVHASILPRWRGAAPITWAIVSGDAETGVCLMQMDEGMDTGPVLASRTIPIGPDETAADLSARLAELGREIVLSELPNVLDKKLIAVPQDGARACAAPMLDKDMGRIDFRKSARQVHDHVRGMTPWPGAFTSVSGKRVKVHKVRVEEAQGFFGAAGGTLAPSDHAAIRVACGEGVIAIEELQLEGKKRVGAKEFVAGARGVIPVRFGEEDA